MSNLLSDVFLRTKAAPLLANLDLFRYSLFPAHRVIPARTSEAVATVTILFTEFSLYKSLNIADTPRNLKEFLRSGLLKLVKVNKQLGPITFIK